MADMASPYSTGLCLCAQLTWPLSLQNGLMSGLMQMLLLKVSAHITEQLGMAPGGEFREAFKEVGAGHSLGWGGLHGPDGRGCQELPRAPQVLTPNLCSRPARCHSASSTWVTDLSQSPSRGPLLHCLSGRKSS